MNRLGLIAYLIIGSVTLLAFAGLFGLSGDGGREGEFSYCSVLCDDYIHQIIWFSFKQAMLSALLSVMLAWPVARALYYLPALPLKKAFLNLCLLCFVMPTLVLVTGLVALLGRSGFLSGIVTEWFYPSWNLYGLGGILLAHIYLNMPFAVRVLTLQMQSTPDTSWRLVQQLKLGPWQRFRIVEWPMVRGVLIMLFGFVFMLCFNSFAIVLALGGGPQSTTLEVAIYQALKYDFNIQEALLLSWVQLFIVSALFFTVSAFGTPSWLSVENHRARWIPEFKRVAKKVYGGIYTVVFVLLILPIVAIIPGAFSVPWHKVALSEFVIPAMISLGLGVFSAAMALCFAYLLLVPIRRALYLKRKRRVLFEWVATHALIAPAMVVSVGLFVFFLPLVDLDSIGIVFVAALNALMVIPFAVQKLKPRLFLYDQQYSRLVQSLQIRGIERVRVEWSFVKDVARSSFALVLVLAMGDVAIFSIFGSSDWQTLPWLIYGYAGSYRLSEASLASLILLVLCAMILWWIEFRESRSHG